MFDLKFKNKKGTKKVPLSCNCYTYYLEEGIMKNECLIAQ